MSFNTILEGTNTDVSLDFEDVDVRIIGSSGGDYDIDVIDCTVVFESSLMNYDNSLVLDLVPKRISMQVSIKTMTDAETIIFEGKITSNLASISNINRDNNRVSQLPISINANNIVVKLDSLPQPVIKMVDIDLEVT